ncbi:hypothetical protein N7462_006107 [Penicillium macrosclerotiorum]|uniref:uncharacterized protein n=1 Tax=Penicillium macrosclerotiorum TaxID=303699 RepID=UPI002546FD3C|nr:uncharacterized protein N7462_006107 [Penicillium macrosclerotiorum]KAJ5682942.1 hypothetical protein N7462_006107 [Penicillium macrosclerotiorum]
MENYHRKVLVTRRSLKYTYYVSHSGKSTKQYPTLLFLHGFPDSAHLWSAVIAFLGNLPNKIIIPDCLGYAGTEKPEDTKLYTYDGQADDLADIIDEENAEFTVIVGHDWGSALAQRTYFHKRQLFIGMVLLNVAYFVPSDKPFDLAATNKLTEKVSGYQQLAYWEFFTSPDCPDIVNRNLGRMWQALHGDVEDWMQKLFCVPGAFRNFLLGNEDVPLKEYAKQPQWIDKFMQQFENGDFAPSLNMYKAALSNLQFQSDLTIPREHLTIEVPLLFIACSRDAVCLKEGMGPAKKQGLVPNFKEVVIDSAHWSPMEKPEEIALHIKDFLLGIDLGR